MSIAYRLRSIYESSPDVVRQTLGSLLGALPATYRYGSAFKSYWNFLPQAERWKPEEKDAYQLRTLREMLDYAAIRVPYYRRLFAKMNFQPEKVKSAADLSCLPLLTRDMVRELDRDLLAEGLPEKSYKYSSTAGTSGKPLGFYITHDASAVEWAFMLRNWSRAGFHPGHRRLVVRGRLISNRQKGRLLEYDPVNQALYFSSFDLNNANLERSMTEIRRYRPDFLHAYPSSAIILAQFLQKRNLALPSLKGMLLGSENLYPIQKEYLSSVFHCPVYSWYGHSEKSILAGACLQEDGYHPYREYGVTELVDEDGAPVKDLGKTGRLVGTGFINRATVFIRYLTDDQAEWAKANCSCGQGELLLKKLSGRSNQEVLVGKSGTIIPFTAINLHSEIYTKIHRFQFLQTTPGQATIKIEKANNWMDGDEISILREFNDRLIGEVGLTLEFVDNLPLTNSGKFKFIDQRIPLHTLRGND